MDNAVKQSLLNKSSSRNGSEKGNTFEEEITNQKKLKYPISVFFIVVNEFCERFSYYGMRTVLTLYLRDILLFDENVSTVLYHVFVMLCYFTPVFGAILADTYLGKFRTILYLSILYAAGNVILSVAAIPNTLPQIHFSLIGLVVIALGTGGIKPCVAAFGGDQFARPQQNKQLEQFFSIFYFAINAGSLISTFLTPILREDVECFGQSTCFPLAFGVPAVLMIVAVVVFFSGKWLYKIHPAEGNVMVDVSRCVSHAVGRKLKAGGSEKRDHWLDFASDKFDKDLIEDTKRVLRVLLLYLPLPVFWALFDQQGSRWTFQATRMDGRLGDVATIKADQLQIANPLLILALVPVFESVVYPLFARCRLLTPLQRIGTGGILAAVAFVVSGIVELNLEPTYERLPGNGLTQLNFINTLPCQVNVDYVIDDVARSLNLNATGYSFERDLKDGNIDVSVRLVAPLCGGIQFVEPQWTGRIHGNSTKAFSVVISDGRNGTLEVTRMLEEEPLKKSISGQPRVGFIVNLDDSVTNEGNVTLRPKHVSAGDFTLLNNVTYGDNRLGQTAYMEIEVGTYEVFVPRADGKVNLDDPAGEIQVLLGGCYTVLIQRSFNQSGEDFLLPIEVTPANSVHMLWLLPQYFIMTVAEVMFSVTGLQFSFTQAPARMRSVMQASWLLTVAFGNLIVIVVAEAKAIDRQSMEFFLFAALMAIDMLLFIFLASRYTYVENVDDVVDVADKEDSGKDKTPVQKAVANYASDNDGYNDSAM